MLKVLTNTCYLNAVEQVFISAIRVFFTELNDNLTQKYFSSYHSIRGEQRPHPPCSDKSFHSWLPWWVGRRGSAPWGRTRHKPWWTQWALFLLRQSQPPTKRWWDRVDTWAGHQRGQGCHHKSASQIHWSKAQHSFQPDQCQRDTGAYAHHTHCSHNVCINVIKCWKQLQK